MFKVKWHNILVLLFVASYPSATLLADSESNDPIRPDSETMQHRVEEKRLRFLLGLEATQLSINGTSTTGAGAQGMFLVGLSRRFQLGFGMRQSFNTRVLSVLYSTIDMRVDFAITGSLALEKSYTGVGGKDVLASIVPNSGGFRTYIALTQYFLSWNSQDSQNSGAGLGVYYDFPSSTTINYYLGVRADRINYGINAVYPAQLYFGLSFWL